METQDIWIQFIAEGLGSSGLGALGVWGAMTVVGSQLRGWYGMVPCGGGGDKSVLPVGRCCMFYLRDSRPWKQACYSDWINPKHWATLAHRWYTPVELRSHKDLRYVACLNLCIS